MSTRCHIAICKNAAEKEDEKFLSLYHHCDGYPGGVGSELSRILTECPLPWTTERVQKFINEYDASYRIIDSNIKWDIEYVYVILCEELRLCCYYKGITNPNEKWILDDCGDELIIPDNVFVNKYEKHVELTVEDIETLDFFLTAVRKNKTGAFTFERMSDKQYLDVLRRFNKKKTNG